MGRKIYLCGPINMCTDEEANDWRTQVKDNPLLREYFQFLDPMIRDYRGVEQAAYREIVDLDKIDVRNSDIILANCTKPSAGTSMEIFYAHQLGKMIVTVAPEPVSPWIRYHSTTIQPTLDGAIDWILETGVTVL